MTAYNLSKIINRLEDKTVAVVGGYLDEIKPADLNPFDFVFWVNNHWLRMPNARIDGLFHCGAPRVPIGELTQHAELAAVQFMAGASFAAEAGALQKFCVDNHIPHLLYGDNPALYWMYEELCWKCQDKCCSEPLTGLIAAHFLHHMPCREIHLLGQNLYSGQAWTLGIRNHNPAGHAEIFRELVRCDRRFKLCREMATCLSSQPAELFSPGTTK